MDVAIVGTGERFASMYALLRANGTSLVSWRPDVQDGDEFPDDLDTVELEALADTPLIFLAVPMSDLREVARQIGDAISARHVIIHACHNLEAGTLATASEILVHETPTRRFGFFSGPMRSEEVGQGLPAAGVCATRFPEVGDLAEECLVHAGFRLYRSSDIVGAEHAAAYGRVIAMAAGVASQMDLGQSVQATLFARGLAEISRWVKLRGGEERTTFGIAGSGNLHLDTAPPGSIDFRVGSEAMQAGLFDPVAIRKRFGSTGRDLMALVESLWEGAEDAKLSAHILRTCHEMVSRELEPGEAVRGLMTLPTLDD